MKKIAVATSLLGTLLLIGSAEKALGQATPPDNYEYIDIRWDGTDRMCVVYGDGRVYFIGKELAKIERPDDANKRAFYMTLAMNRMAAQGYEFAGIISDEIIMKRRRQ